VARTGAVALVLLVLAVCSFAVPAAGAPAAPPSQIVRHTAVIAVANGSTTVPASHPKKAVKLGSVLWAVLAVAVLAAAVATPLLLRRYREARADTKGGNDDN
jgi:hypothetical protein